MGGNVRGAGGSIITVEGKRALHGGKYRIIADRIVGATYLCAAACCGGEVRLRGVDPRPLSTVSGALSEAGCTVKSGEDDVFLQSDGSLRSIRPVRTAPYPGFPTDAQPVLMAALLKSAGSTVFVENIFENRYRHVDELARMGAEVRVAGRVAVVTGREHLHGARVKCTDLRAGAALVIAGLQADGLTRISRIEHIDRGYESIERDLGVLGAHVRRETGTSANEEKRQENYGVKAKKQTAQAGKSLFPAETFVPRGRDRRISRRADDVLPHRYDRGGGQRALYRGADHRGCGRAEGAEPCAAEQI